MALSWNEIRSRAISFAHEWASERKETGEYQSFWNEFFEIFGVRRRSVAHYQSKVDQLDKGRGFIDLFWPGMLIVEHKSAGQDLDSAFSQAGGYFEGLSEEERPRYIIVSDYQRIRLYDLEGKAGTEKQEFVLRDLPAHIRLFGFIAGYEERVFKDEDPINVKAIQKI